MARGATKNVGDRFTNKNGYTYEKTESGWEPVQKLIAERKLGRSLIGNERAYFKDGDRTNLDPDNIGVKVTLDKKSPQAKIVILEAQIKDLEDMLIDLREQRDALLKQLAES